GNVLERGELVLRFEATTGSFAIFYHEHRLPVDPRDYPVILRMAAGLLTPGAIAAIELEEFSSLSAAFARLPDRRNAAPGAIAERQRDKEALKRRLAAMCVRQAPLAEAIVAATRAFAGGAERPSAQGALHGLLESQAYRLAYWRVAADEINYRRFFDVNDLAALRMENEVVFEATHALVLRLIAQRSLDGLRIDHPDGLYDPAGYFGRLQRRIAEVLRPDPGPAGDPPRNSAPPLYVVAEKITAEFERLPEDWPVAGTTGYRFANVVNALMVDPRARRRFDHSYGRFIGASLKWADVTHEAKHLVLGTSLAAELNVLSGLLLGIARAAPKTRDFTLSSLRQALAELIACFPVYRTYIAASVSADDVRYVDWALTSARRRTPAIDAAVYDFVRAVLLQEASPSSTPIAQAARSFTQKLQQVTAPVTAKGVEDTALYRFNRLASLNEVGGQPDTFGSAVSAFHRDARYRAQHWPGELLATSTHDTKRSEDVRARIDVLSEMPREWRSLLERWSRINRSRKRVLDEAPAPSRNDEYLLYQTLLGSMPLENRTATLADYTRRIESYMVKAVREAKLQSSWSNVNAKYEAALQEFIREILDPRAENLFLADLVSAVQRIADCGLLNSLSQTLCKLTAPGVPDTYQGTEIWDFSLVDPDNRRPVDFALRRRMLDAIRTTSSQDRRELRPFLAGLLTNLADGRAKLYVVWKALQLRSRLAPLYASGRYLPLKAGGTRALHLCAFGRLHEGAAALTIVPRLCFRLVHARAGQAPLGEEVWQDTHIALPRKLAGAQFTNVLDGGDVRARDVPGGPAVRVAEALANFPLALLSLRPAR
ncbi:MAG: malto-oligosyltrehalose synthase, partial [Gammaproteobacteria bacterium]|nr:malto-oligosyltrehalose synthase [Gammaproteobacteria bacterium]